MSVARFTLALLFTSGLLIGNLQARPLCENMFINIITKERVSSALDLNKKFTEMGIGLQFDQTVSVDSMFRVMGIVDKVLDYSRLDSDEKDWLNGLTISLAKGNGTPVSIIGKNIRILESATSTSISLALLEYLGKGAPVHIKMQGLLEQYGMTASISSTLSEDKLEQHYSNLKSVLYVLETTYPGFTFNSPYNLSFYNDSRSSKVSTNDNSAVIYTNARYQDIMNAMMNVMVQAPGSIQYTFRTFLYENESNRSTVYFASGLSQKTLKRHVENFMEIFSEIQKDNPNAVFRRPLHFVFYNDTRSSRISTNDEGSVAVYTNAEREQIKNVMLNNLVRPQTAARTKLEDLLADYGTSTHLGYVNDTLDQDIIERVYKAFELEMEVVKAKHPEARLKEGYSINLYNDTRSSKISFNETSVAIYTNASQDFIREFIRRHLIDYNLPIDMETE